MSFDANRFLNTVYTEAFDTKRPLMPEGDWRCYIQGVDVGAGNKEDTVLMRITLVFDDEELAKRPEFEGREKITMNTTIFIDVDKETGLIKHAGGMNWQLGQVRAAAGQNNPGVAWNPNMLAERGPMIVSVYHTEIKKEDDKGRKVGIGEFRDNIQRWTAI